MFYRPGVGLSAYRRLVAVADAWLVRRVEEFDLSSAVGVGGLTAAAGIAIRSASCQQPRVAALVAQQQRLAFAPSLDGVTAHPTCAAPAAPAAPAVSLLLSLAARGLCAAPAGHMLMQTVRELGCAA